MSRSVRGEFLNSQALNGNTDGTEHQLEPEPVIQAREILAKIERGEDVEYDGVIIEGDLIMFQGFHL